MSSVVESTELLSFDGVVECGRRAGAIALRLRGVQHEERYEPQHEPQREVGGITELLFADVRAPLQALPAQLHAVHVLKLPPSAAMLAGREPGPAQTRHAATAAAYAIEAREGHFELQARSVQLHREVAATFFQAVPPASVPRALRLGWGLLLGLLRLPGAARLLGSADGAGSE